MLQGTNPTLLFPECLPKRAEVQQMRVVFVGRKWAFNDGFINWLNQHYDLCGIFYVEPGASSIQWRLRAILQRVSRQGLFRTLDQLLFRVFYKLRFGPEERRLWTRLIPAEFRFPRPCDKPADSCEDIHEERWLQKIKAIEPDIILSVCTRVIFRQELLAIPRFGTFVLHEGITPEYRGLHTTTWALLRGEWKYIGYTLLKVGDRIDGGPILCQGRYRDAEKYGFYSILVGHLALLEGLSEIKKALDRLFHDGGDFQPVAQANRASNYYSWVPLSTYLRQRLVSSVTGQVS